MKLLRMFLVFLLLSPVFATDYYVKNGGNDGNSGLDDDNAWETIGKVESSAGINDTVYFKCGDVWRDTLSPPADGMTFTKYDSGDNPVIMGSEEVIGVGGDWNNEGGDVWSRALTTECKIVVFDTTHLGVEDADPDAQYDWDWVSNELFVYATENPTTYYTSIEAGQRNNCIRNTRDDTTLDGVDLRVANTQGFLSNGSDAVPDMANLTISYCDSAGIWWEDNTGTFTIDNVDVFYCTTSGLKIQDTGEVLTSGTIKNCEIGYVGIGLGWGHCIDIHQCEYITIENNHLHHSYIGSGVGGDRFQHCIIQNNEINNVYYTGVDLTGHTAKDCEYNIVRYNLIHDNVGAANDAGITCWSETGAGSYARYNEIYYNIIYGCTYGIYISSRSEDNEIYNNVIYDCGTGGNEAGIAIVEGTGGSTFPKNNEFKNNIVYAISGKLIYTNQAGDGSNTLDYNCYYPEGVGHFEWNDTDYDTLVAYRAASGQEANSIKDDPSFVTPGSDFHIQVGSPCKDDGVNVGLSLDYFGNMVWSGTAPDIGAHEYQQGDIPKVRIREILRIRDVLRIK